MWKIHFHFPNKILKYDNQDKAIPKNEFAFEKSNILDKLCKGTLKMNFFACNNFIERKCIRCHF